MPLLQSTRQAQFQLLRTLEHQTCRSALSKLVWMTDSMNIAANRRIGSLIPRMLHGHCYQKMLNRTCLIQYCKSSVFITTRQMSMCLQTGDWHTECCMQPCSPRLLMHCNCWCQQDNQLWPAYDSSTSNFSSGRRLFLEHTFNQVWCSLLRRRQLGKRYWPPNLHTKNHTISHGLWNAQTFIHGWASPWACSLAMQGKENELSKLLGCLDRAIHGARFSPCVLKNVLEIAEGVNNIRLDQGCNSDRLTARLQASHLYGDASFINEAWSHTNPTRFTPTRLALVATAVRNGSPCAIQPTFW